MKSSKRRLQALTEGSDGLPNYLKMDESESSIPPVFRSRLHDLFSQIEKEFDLLYNENLNCKIFLFIIIVSFFFSTYFNNNKIKPRNMYKLVYIDIS